jgi:hypothetical protein
LEPADVAKPGELYEGALLKSASADPSHVIYTGASQYAKLALKDDADSMDWSSGADGEAGLDLSGPAKRSSPRRGFDQEVTWMYGGNPLFRDHQQDLDLDYDEMDEEGLVAQPEIGDADELDIEFDE